MEVTAVTQADTNRQGAGEGRRVMKRTVVPHGDARELLVLKASMSQREHAVADTAG